MRQLKNIQNKKHNIEYLEVKGNNKHKDKPEKVRKVTPIEYRISVP